MLGKPPSVLIERDDLPGFGPQGVFVNQQRDKLNFRVPQLGDVSQILVNVYFFTEPQPMLQVDTDQVSRQLRAFGAGSSLKIIKHDRPATSFPCGSKLANRLIPRLTIHRAMPAAAAY
jgi:hypothetical protein